MKKTGDIAFADLPASLPVFPLPGVVLLPRVALPLNVFEPRYLAMTDDAMAGDRLIGIIQKKENGDLFKTGCAGRITSFQETEDGRYLISLKGICRFDVAREGPENKGGYRVVTPDWAGYRNDFEPEKSTDLCREMMVQKLKRYFNRMGMTCDQWQHMKDISCEKLISTLSVICPFGADEKQTLLEAKTIEDRARYLQVFLDGACKAAEEEDGNCKTCH